jgi:ketosteroid isomerase-like protein
VLAHAPQIAAYLEEKPMGSVENKQVIRDAFTAWANGDGMAFFNLLAEDATWTVMGSCPISGTYVGRQRLVEDALTPQREKLAGPPTPTVLNLIAEGDTVVIQWVGKGTAKTGQPYNNSYCYVVQMENGKITRGTAYLDTALVRSVW